MRKEFKILFLSGRDCSASLIAEGLLEARTDVTVAGFCAGVESEVVAPQVAQVLRDVGVTILPDGCCTLRDLGQKTFDLIITLDSQAQEYCRVRHDNEAQGTAERSPLFVGMPIHLFWPVGDIPQPTAEDQALTAFRELRDRLRQRLDVLHDDGYLASLAAQRKNTLLLIDSLGDGIIMHDNSRYIHIFNRAAERITGYEREDVLGRDCHVVFGPEGICGGQCSFRQGSIPPDIDHEYQVSFITADGERKLLRMTVTPTETGGGIPGGVIASMRDITEVSELRWQLKEKYSFHGMVGVSPTMQEVFQTIRQVVASDYPVLITGESGTGKELVANAIHNEGRRRGGPFVPVNCGALPENILESELFGHVRGAFTGAIRDKKGRFELADGGTLFLDEIGELTPAFQVKLLRVLQEKRFERVGGEQPISVDVRIISATNRDPREMLKEGKFREDLFYRLSVVPIKLPPLRDRCEDIPPLVEHILRDIRKETEKKDLNVSGKVIDQLLCYGWPGNVRELINALRFSAVRCAGNSILLRHLHPEIRQVDSTNLPPLPTTAAYARSTPPKSRKKGRLDRDAVKSALAEAGGNKVMAAKILGVGRATLYRFLERHPVSG